ncbi:MAG: ABC transporter substrate-binding protein [Alphaproteobacteria bacterium]|nr:ABC transporter substrate-binding protein [Alphaproteobacteria bacterium]
MRRSPIFRTGPSLTRRRFGAGLAVGAGAFLAPSILRGAEPDAIRVGQTEALTGPSSAYGIRAANGAKLAVEQINATGVQIGGATYKFDFSFNDMANDTRQAVTLLRQYASQSDIICGIGPTNSVGFVGMVPVAEQLSFPLIGDGSGVPLKEWNSWVVRVNPVNATGTPVLLKKIVAKEKIKRLGVIFDQTQDSQRSDAEICKSSAGLIGYEVVSYEAFRTGDQDFSPQIASLRANKPDAIFVAAAMGDGVKVVTQIREAGFDKSLISGVSSFTDPLYWDSTKGGVKDGFCWLAADLQAPSPSLKKFLDDYKARYDQQATAYCAYGADAVFTLAAALQKAGKVDRMALRDVVTKIDHTTPLGTHVKFNNPPNGENLDPTIVTVQATGRGVYQSI